MDEHEEQQLHDMARGGRFWEWQYQRGRRYERATLTADWSRLTPWSLTFRIGVAALAGGSFMFDAPWWIATLAIAGLAWLMSYGVLWPIRIAHAYRNGWVDRGSHSIAIHAMTCGDPVSQTAYEYAVQHENAEAMRAG